MSRGNENPAAFPASALDHERLRRAVALTADSDGLLIAAGAGMSADSGLPTFRGSRGFWAAYPALGEAKLDFTAVASADTFARDPRLAWGFYGHRLQLYRRTLPHAGYALLRMIGARLAHGAFVFTSNVDGAFEKAGFETSRVVECHGSIHHLQCLHNCSEAIWSAEGISPRIDERACRLLSALPRCPGCDAVARPNILLFGDWSWIARRAEEQQARLDAWIDELDRPVVVEIGAGTAIPTVRYYARSLGVPIIRINPEPAADEDDPSVVTMRSGALAGISALAQGLLEGPWSGMAIEI